MILENAFKVNRIGRFLNRLFKEPEPPPQVIEIIPPPPPQVIEVMPPLPVDHPPIWELAKKKVEELPLPVQACPVAMRFLSWLGQLDWEHFPERSKGRAWPGPVPQAKVPYVAAYLVKVVEGKRYMTDLRKYLVEHPALIWVLGFRLEANNSLWGFDPEASVPSRKHLGRVLRELPNQALQFLLGCTVALLKEALPADSEFGNTIAMDTKAILAWVAENNPKTYILESDRLDKTRQPTGDPDCKLGCKRRRNHAPADPAEAKPVKFVGADKTPTTRPKPATNLSAIDEFYWGYASGIVTTKIPAYGEFVLAEMTKTFDEGDATYFFPLMAQLEANLGFKPQYGAFDCSYDAFYVYDYFKQSGGFAAIPFASRGGYNQDFRQFNADGLPICKAGLSMPLKGTFVCHTETVDHERGRYACPLLHPEATGQPCPIADKHFANGGCLTTMPTCEGARIRYQLDRSSEEYKRVYNQRTATERINSQAKEHGIERPMFRNKKSVANANTLIYIIINLKAVDRVRAGVANKQQ